MNEQDIEILWSRIQYMSGEERSSVLNRLFGAMEARDKHAKISGNENMRDSAQEFFIALHTILGNR